MRVPMHPPQLRTTLPRVCVAIALLVGGLPAGSLAQAPAKVIGTVKSASGSSVVVALDNATDTTITFTDTSRILRAVPGQDLKSAAPIQVSEIQVGDRISARGQAADANSLSASFALVMRKSDIAQKQQQERDEWRKGVGGLVKEINSATGTINIA